MSVCNFVLPENVFVKNDASILKNSTQFVNIHIPNCYVEVKHGYYTN